MRNALRKFAEWLMKVTESPAIQHYRMLQAEVLKVRTVNEGRESTIEDWLMDGLEKTWPQLTDAEMATINAEGPKCWPKQKSVSRPAYRGFASPVDAIDSAELPSPIDWRERAILYAQIIGEAAEVLEVLRATECDEAGIALAPGTKRAIVAATDRIRAGILR